MKSLLIALCCCWPLFAAIEAYGQSNFPSSGKDEYYLRMLQVVGVTDDGASWMLRPYTEYESDVIRSHPWEQMVPGDDEPIYSLGKWISAGLYQPAWFQSYNTRLPRGAHDGAIWQGRGYNTAFTIGGEFTAGPLHVRLRPVVGMSQNREFNLGPHRPQNKNIDGVMTPFSRYAYPTTAGIDYVQRFGDSSYSWIDPGDSSVELRQWGVRLAYSNQRIWTGPGINTSLHFGYNAPGFRHLYFGTYQPLKTIAGTVEFAYIFGQTRESEYYSEGRIIGSHSINSLVFIYRPWFSGGLSIGVARTFYHMYPESFSQYKNQALKLFEAALKESLKDEENPTGDDPDNQNASVFLRYVLSDYGVEFYLEFGRNDHNMDWRDFRAHPDHFRAYVMGINKTFLLANNRFLGVNFELNQLEGNRVALARGFGITSWYTHAQQILGVSNQGQLMGSGYGPGMNLQIVRAELFDERGSLAVKGARIVYDNNRLDSSFETFRNANYGNVERWEIRNIEYMAGVEATAFLPYGIELCAVIEQSLIMNQHHLRANDYWNTRIELVARKQMRNWKR